MTRLQLHCPTNQAHLGELQDRLTLASGAGTRPRFDGCRAEHMVATLVDVVRAMDRGALSWQDARYVFGAFEGRIPGFRFDAWLADMLDEGVYVANGEPLPRAA